MSREAIISFLRHGASQRVSFSFVTPNGARVVVNETTFQRVASAIETGGSHLSRQRHLRLESARNIAHRRKHLAASPRTRCGFHPKSAAWSKVRCYMNQFTHPSI